MRINSLGLLKLRILKYLSGHKIKILTAKHLDAMNEEMVALRERTNLLGQASKEMELAIYSKENLTIDLEDKLRDHKLEITELKDRLDTEISNNTKLYGEFARFNTIERRLGYADRGNKKIKINDDIKKNIIIIGMTTVSQAPLLKALCESAAIGNRYIPVVVAFVDINHTEIKQYCDAHNILLYDFKYRLILDEYYDTSNSNLFAYPAISVVCEGGETGICEQHIVDFFNEVRRLSSDAQDCEHFLNSFDASLLVVFEDNPEYASKTLIGRARARDIPTVIVPFTIADEIEVAEAYLENKEYRVEDSFFNRFVARVWPRWVFNYQSRALLRSRGVCALADEALCAAPALPWKSGSTRASYIAVESDAMMDWYLANGAAESQLVLTGSIIDDAIVDGVVRQNEVRQLLNIEPGKRVLLCSFPPNQLDGSNRMTEWSSFDELIEFWGGKLGQILGWDVIIKPHPSLANVYVEKLRSMGLKVSNLDTAELLPLCTIYNACVSSTIRWALALGKPVLNFDAFAYKYREFQDEAGVWTVGSRVEFESALAQLTADAGRLQTQLAAAQAGAPRWGQLDGKAGERLCSLFDRATRPQTGRAFAQQEAMAEGLK